MGKASEAYKALVASKGAVLIPPGLIEKIVNGDFERGDFTGWSSGGAIITSDPTNVHSGSYAADLTPGSYGEYIQQIVGEIPVGEIDSCIFWYKGHTTTLGINYTEVIGQAAVGSSFSLPNVDVWTKYDLTSYIRTQVPSTGGFVLISFYNYDNNLDCYVDDVSLKARA